MRRYLIYIVYSSINIVHAFCQFLAFHFNRKKKKKLNRIVNHIQSAIIFISTLSLTEMSGEQHKCSLKILQCLHLLIVLCLLALSVAIALIHKISNSPQVVHSFLQFSRLHLIFKFIKWWPPTAMCKLQTTSG